MQKAYNPFYGFTCSFFDKTGPKTPVKWFSRTSGDSYVYLEDQTLKKRDKFPKEGGGVSGKPPPFIGVYRL